MMNKAPIATADGQTVPGLVVNLYAGPTGSTSGQFGRFASVVAEARDLRNGTGFVRRLELSQESFAKFAYWTNSENSSTGATIVFANGDALWGPVWSNDTITIGTGGANFHNDVGTAAPLIVNATAATFVNGYEVSQKPIPLPTLTTLASLSGLATVSGFNFTPPNTGASTGVLMRIEFLATDLNGAGDSTAANDGFFRVYTAKAGNSAWLRADWPSGSLPSASSTHELRGLAQGPHERRHDAQVLPVRRALSCGLEQHLVRHGDRPRPAGRRDRREHRGVARGSGLGEDDQRDIQWRASAPQRPLLPRRRPAPGRDGAHDGLGYADTLIHKGGEDSTFTPSDQYGAWTLYSNTPPPRSPPFARGTRNTFSRYIADTTRTPRA